MTFSKHVGLEPANDLRERMMFLAQEAGLQVLKASMLLQRETSIEDSYRTVMVWVKEPNWKGKASEGLNAIRWEHTVGAQIELRAIIYVNGTYDGRVNLNCMASEDDTWLDVPILRQCWVDLNDLRRKLRLVVSQQAEVIAAVKRGERGPWIFGDMVWRSGL